MVKRKRKSSRIQNKERFEQEVACLPLCVVSEILSKLPAEMILRCRCVCKSWYALTHESSFIAKQFQWSKHHESSRYMLQVRYGSSTHNLSLLDIHEKVITKISFNQMKLPMPTYRNQYKLSAYSIVCAYNGLLCLRPKGKIDNVIICNPITKDCLVLPSTTVEPFKPCMSYQLGLYFDDSSRKYKVIREFRFFSNQPSKFEMITIGESSWKDLNAPNCVVEQGFDAAIFWNQAFHWKISETFITHVNDCILSFDLIEEKFFTISFPRDEDGKKYYPQNFQLVGLRGGLKIVEHERSRFLKIWIVTGNKIEGFAMVLQYTYTFCIPPSRMLQHDVISEIYEETYLMQVSTWKLGINKCTLQIFSPRTRLQDLNINGLPLLFKIICFKPSLISPLA